MAEDKNTKSGATANSDVARPTGAARPSSAGPQGASRGAAAGSKVATKTSKKVAKRSSDEDQLSTRNPITFIKQVFAELRKVIWPTARQMVTYTAVVLLFLIFMVVLVWGIDTLSGLGVRSIFSN